jgi:hypothetical protein
MKSPAILRVAICAALVSIAFSGCKRYIDWGKDVFCQGEKFDAYERIPRVYLRSARVYDQFTTMGLFTALWLADEVRLAYSCVHARRRGMDEDLQSVFTRRQLEENNHFISFYLLAAEIGDDTLLSNESPPWTIYAQIDGENYKPIEIRYLTSLPMEYRFFFGDYLTSHQQMYLVKFNARDINNKRLINNNVRALSLWLTDGNRKVELKWCLDNKGRVPHCIPWPRNILAYDYFCPGYEC